MTTEVTEINKGGRPKGSRNQITLLKIAMEQSSRERNAAKIQRVIDDIIDAALDGDRDCRKLVWQSVMSKSGAEQQQNVGALPEIVIRTEGSAPKARIVETIDNAED